VGDLVLQSRQGVQPRLDLEAMYQRAYDGNIDAAAAVLDPHFLDQDAIRFERHDTA
jgi:hypothetical protein